MGQRASFICRILTHRIIVLYFRQTCGGLSWISLLKHSNEKSCKTCWKVFETRNSVEYHRFDIKRTRANLCQVFYGKCTFLDRGGIEIVFYLCHLLCIRIGLKAKLFRFTWPDHQFSKWKIKQDSGDYSDSNGLPAIFRNGDLFSFLYSVRFCGKITKPGI